MYFFFINCIGLQTFYSQSVKPGMGRHDDVLIFPMNVLHPFTLVPQALQKFVFVCNQEPNYL